VSNFNLSLPFGHPSPSQEREIRTKRVDSPFLLSEIPSKTRDLGEREIGIEVKIKK